MESLLVVGASGLLGQHLVHQAKSSFERVLGTYFRNAFEIEGIGTRELDITSHEDVLNLFEKKCPGFVIMASALTGVDYCEEHPEEAAALNIAGPLNIAKACEKYGSKLLHVSTDYVFDGQKGNYTEKDEPNPISVYGRTKLDGEKAVLESVSESVVARVCVLYGWNRITTKTNFVTWVMNTLEEGGQAKLFQDQTITPTYAHEAAGVLLQLLRKNISGIFHASGSQSITRFQMGKLVANTFRLNEDMVIPATMDEAGLTAMRPRDSSLNVEKTEKELNIRMNPLPASLTHMRDNR